MKSIKCSKRLQFVREGKQKANPMIALDFYMRPFLDNSVRWET